MQTFLRRFAVPLLTTLWLLQGCATLVGPRNVEIPLSQLQQAIETKFPANKSLFPLLDMTLTQPKLSLLPDKNRLRLSLDTAIAPSLVDRTWTGSVTVSGSLALDARGEAVILKSPRVEALTLDGESPAVSAQVRKLGNFFVEQFLEDVPLHRFEPDRLTMAGVRMRPVAIATRADGIVVTFEPVR